MAEILQGGPVFNALDGTEVARAAMAQIEPEIKRALAEDSNFAAHLTYPVVEWTWTLEVKAYPHEPGSFRGRAAGRFAPPKVTILRGGRVVNSSSDETTPDAVRAEAGIPVTRPERTSAGIMSDVPQPLQEERSGRR